MSNYTKTTNFAAKDSLPSGNANKIVKGTEIDTEFDNIATASATKADIAGPTFTGTVTIPTVDLNGGAIDDTTVGASTAAAITGTTIVANTSINIAGDGATVTGIKDEDDMSSNSATKLATQQSIKAYVDSQVTAQDLDFQADSGGALSIDLDSETLTFTGGTGVDTSGSGNAVTFAIDSTVATLTGSQTLTNKSLTAPTLTGTAVVASLDISGDIDVDGTANLDVVDIDGAVDFASTTAHAGNATFADNAKAIFGAGSDLQIFHNGTESFIREVGTGGLKIDSNGPDLTLRVNATESAIVANANGSVDLYYDNALKLATTSTGIDVTGVITTDGMTTSADINFGDNDKAIFGAGSDLQIFSEGSTGNSFISEEGSGTLFIQGTDLRFRSGQTPKENFITAIADGAVTLYHNNAAKLATTSTGIDVTGTVTADGLTVDGVANFNANNINYTGSSPRINFYENDETNLNSQLINTLGDFFIRTVSDDGATTTNRFSLDHATGDISFYEDTGTTPKLFWDASAESLGIGTTSPSNDLHIKGAGAANIRLEQGNGSNYGLIKQNQTSQLLQLGVGGSFGININSSNQVGIGTSAPERTLHVDSASVQIGALISNTSTVASRLALMDANTTNSARVGIGATGDNLGLYAGGAERATIDSSGNVLVGRTSRLSSQVESISSDTVVSAHGDLTAHQTSTVVLQYNSANNLGMLRAYGATAGTGQLRFNVGGGGGSTDFEAMRIDSSGNLLVGTTNNSPVGNNVVGIGLFPNGSAQLSRDGGTVLLLNRKSSDGTLAEFRRDSTSVVGSIRSIAGQDIVIGSGSAGLRFLSSGPALQPRNSNGNANNDAIDIGLSGNRFKDLYLSGISYSNTVYSDLNLTLAADYNNNSSTGNSNILFQTDGTERMRLDASGGVRIGTSSHLANGGEKLSVTTASDSVCFQTSASNSSGTSLHLNRSASTGNLLYLTYGSFSPVGTINTNGTSVSYNTSSDQRLKDNIVDAPSASDDIDAIQVRSFDWKADGSHQKYGMVAQELQSVAPEAVSGDADSDEMMGVDYSKLVPMLVKEIQSLRNRVAQLENN